MKNELGAVDDTTGAPPLVRMLVGGTTKQEDRLATIRRIYPGAFQDPVDPENFIFKNPDTGKMTLYNPKGLDTGDVASVTREVTQAAGSAAGATLGVPAGLPGIAGGSMLGAAAGEEVYQLLAKALGAQDSRTTKERLGDTAYAGVTGLGGPVGAGVQQGASATVKGLMRGASGERVARAIEDAAKFNFSPSLATATKNKTLDMLENFTARTPGGFGVIRKEVDKTLSAVKGRIDEITNTLAGTSPEKDIAGRAIEKGITAPKTAESVGGFVARFNTRAAQLYSDIPIDAGQPVSMKNTLRLLTEMTADIPGAENTSDLLKNKALVGILDKMRADVGETGALPFQAVKMLRTKVGQNAASANLISDVSRGEWKQLYGAMSDDIKAAADEAGPAARKAFDRANNFWKAGNKRIDDVLEPLVRNKTAERIYDALDRGAKQGPTVINAVRRSLTDDQWDVVLGEVVKKMGQPAPGKMVEESIGFSFDSFLTNWNKFKVAGTIDPLLGNRPQLKADLSALVRISQHVRESSQAFANPSGTAGAGIGQLMLLGSFGSVGTAAITGDLRAAMLFPAITAMGAVSTNAMARLMTSPKFVRWVSLAAKVKPNGFGAHLGRLAQVAAGGDIDLKNAVLEYAGVFDSGAQE